MTDPRCGVCQRDLFLVGGSTWVCPMILDESVRMWRCAQVGPAHHPKPLPLGMSKLLTEINSLPTRTREYVRDLECRADPTCDVQDNIMLRDVVDGLWARVRQLESEVQGGAVSQ